MAQDVQFTRALDSVKFWQAKVARRFHKNAKKLATWNLWAAEDRAQHMAEAHQQGTVQDYNGPNPINFELPVYRGNQTDPEIDDD